MSTRAQVLKSPITVFKERELKSSDLSPNLFTHLAQTISFMTIDLIETSGKTSFQELLLTLNIFPCISLILPEDSYQL